MKRANRRRGEGSFLPRHIDRGPTRTSSGVFEVSAFLVTTFDGSAAFVQRGYRQSESTAKSAGSGGAIEVDLKGQDFLKLQAFSSVYTSYSEHNPEDQRQ